jgi:drug/metabolite transporter (DMT)-like permease
MPGGLPRGFISGVGCDRVPAEAEGKPFAPLMLLMAIAIIAVSTSSIFVKWSSSAPLAIALFRLVYSTLFVLPFAVRGPLATRRDLGLMAVSGLSLSAHFFLWITSLSYTSVAESVLLVTTHPVPVALVSAHLLREKPNRLQAAGIATAVAGMAALVLVPALETGFQGGDRMLGNILAFLGALAMVPYLVIGRMVRPRVGIGRYAATVYGVALYATVIYVLLGDIPLPGADLQEHALFIAMALVPGILGHTLYNYLLKHLPAFVVSSTLLFEPVGAAILALLLLGQVPHGVVVAAGAVLLIGLYLITRGEAMRTRIHTAGGSGNESNKPRPD